VPQWYQRRFLPGGRGQFFYLDLKPDTVVCDGVPHQRDALLRWGPKKCFYRDDLYTVRLGRWTTDEIERRFFGEVDRRGRDAVAHFAELDGIVEGTFTPSRDLVAYMDAQKFRTPRGLDLIKFRTGSLDHNVALAEMQGRFQYTTMWTEGVWEIVRARRSPTKFIVADDPVAFYCKVTFPLDWDYPHDVMLRQLGTRTIFPLGLESCLIVTHLEFVRNPWATPTMHRTNARSYQTAMKYLGDIQYGRELEEDEVQRINLILKKRAVRYIAAAREEWLYPEARVSGTDWTKLDDDWFLLPHLWRVPFTTELVLGWSDGSGGAWDEYGRRPWQHGYGSKQQREQEWETFQKAKKEWARRRIGKSRAQTDERLEGRCVADEMMDDFLRKEGLLLAGPPESSAPA
jgi:hypothetical protein